MNSVFTFVSAASGLPPLVDAMLESGSIAQVNLNLLAEHRSIFISRCSFHRQNTRSRPKPKLKIKVTALTLAVQQQNSLASRVQSCLA